MEFWLIMVYYEFEILRNPIKARKVFHQGLILNKENPNFWIQYFQFEVSQFELFERRRQVLVKNNKTKATEVAQKMMTENEEVAQKNNGNANNDQMLIEANDELIMNPTHNTINVENSELSEK